MSSWAIEALIFCCKHIMNYVWENKTKQNWLKLFTSWSQNYAIKKLIFQSQRIQYSFISLMNGKCTVLKQKQTSEVGMIDISPQGSFLGSPRQCWNPEFLVAQTQHSLLVASNELSYAHHSCLCTVHVSVILWIWVGTMHTILAYYEKQNKTSNNL